MEKRTFSLVGWGLAVGIVGSYLAQYVVGFFVGIFLSFTGPVMLDSPAFWAVFYLGIYCVIYGVGILSVWLFTMKLPSTTPRWNPMSIEKSLLLIVVVFVIGMGAADILDSIGRSVHNSFYFILHRDYEDVLGESFSMIPQWVLFLITCVFAPVCEELIYRKFVIDKLRPFGDKVAILYSGLAFGLFHLNFQQFFYTAVLGMLWAYVYLKTNKIWHVMLLHSLMNFFGGMLFSINNAFFGYENAAVMYYGITLAFWIVGGCLAVSLRKKVSLTKPTQLSVPINGKLVVNNAGTIVFIACCGALFAWNLIQ